MHVVVAACGALHDDELVTADARGDIARPDRGAQPVCDLTQELIADGMTIPVVHRLEAVEIQAVHGDPDVVMTGPQHLVEVLPQPEPVQETRQHVVTRDARHVVALRDLPGGGPVTAPDALETTKQKHRVDHRDQVMSEAPLQCSSGRHRDRGQEQRDGAHSGSYEAPHDQAGAVPEHQGGCELLRHCR